MNLRSTEIIQTYLKDEDILCESFLPQIVFDQSDKAKNNKNVLNI